MRYKRYVLSLFLIMVMVAIAEITGEREIIFPEVAALVVGSWIVERQPWKISKVGMVILMTLGSIVGIIIVRYLHIPLTLQVLIGLIFAGGVLKFTKTTLVPVVSACILPILLRTETIVYPISVFILTMIIVSIQYFVKDYNINDENHQLKEEINSVENSSDNRKKELVRIIKIIGIVGLLTLLAVRFNETLLIAPPLIVAFIELTNEHCKFRDKPKNILILFVIASIIGAVFRIGLNEVLGLPLWVCTIGILVSMFICFEKFNIYFPPIAAISILPMLLKSNQVMFYPLQVAIGCSIFISLAIILFKEDVNDMEYKNYMIKNTINN